jgi:hypothetical protein
MMRDGGGGYMLVIVLMMRDGWNACSRWFWPRLQFAMQSTHSTHSYSKKEILIEKLNLAIQELHFYDK